jgi:hypothetical protein
MRKRPSGHAQWGAALEVAVLALRSRPGSNLERNEGYCGGGLKFYAASHCL